MLCPTESSVVQYKVIPFPSTRYVPIPVLVLVLTVFERTVVVAERDVVNVEIEAFVVLWGNVVEVPALLQAAVTNKTNAIITAVIICIFFIGTNLFPFCPSSKSCEIRLTLPRRDVYKHYIIKKYNR